MRPRLLRLPPSLGWAAKERTGISARPCKTKLRHQVLVQPSLAAAYITGCVWHCNRHTFCSWLAMSGASIKGIQEAASHKTITMTARYSHLSPALCSLWWNE
ncbi:tyrosine-type recombinase/integrase [Edaphobacter modestus]|uniref:tyrosine-type recombinase/integrase n=1 Tax=Edaphobacter modestus TaxID=388466 RepID=UPI00102CE6AE